MSQRPPRKKLPEKIETGVLVKSARRCALCFHLEGDFHEKDGQLAHLDHNPANISADNLVFLCLVHHTRYDSKTSQHKNYTQGEVKHARDKLYEWRIAQAKSPAAPGFATGRRPLAARKVAGRRTIRTEVFHCVPLVDDARPLRQAGITEFLPDIVLQFHGDPGPGRIADIWVYANTNITSRLGPDALSEATLSLATGYCATRMPMLNRGIRAVQVAANGLAFFHVPLHELLSLPPSERNLRISNVRVNAAQLGLSAFRPSYISLYIKVSDTTVSPNPQFAVATPAANLKVQVLPAVRDLDLGRLRQSQSLNSDLFTEKRRVNELTALVRFSRKIAPYEPVGERTRLLVRFNNIPKGVKIFTTIEQVLSVPATLSAMLTGPCDLQGSGPIQKPVVDGHVIVGGRSIGLSGVAIWGTDGVAAWEVQGGSNDEGQEITLGLVVAYQGDPSQYLPHLGIVTLNGSLAPLSTVMTASSSASIPRFVDVSSALAAFSIIA